MKEGVSRESRPSPRTQNSDSTLWKLTTALRIVDYTATGNEIRDLRFNVRLTIAVVLDEHYAFTVNIVQERRGLCGCFCTPRPYG